MSIIEILIGFCVVGSICLGFGLGTIKRLRNGKQHYTNDPDTYFCERFKDIINKVKPLYTSHTRFYHNWAHIQEGLDFMIKNHVVLMNELGNSQSKHDRLVLAWLFHDAVYNISNTNNERASGNLALDTLGYGNFHFDFLGLDKIIMTTAHHDHSECATSRLLCDIDLMRLGSDWDAFVEYSEQMYNEYKSVVPDREEFMKLRAAFFQKLLEQRTPIFKTKFISDMYEHRAQSNIRRFIYTHSK